MSQETLSLESNIATQLDLISGIANIEVVEGSPILEFDGNDWYNLPIPSNNDFDITFNVKASATSNYEGAFYFAANDSTYIGLVTHLNNPASKRWNLNVSNSDGSFAATITGAVNSVNTFVKIRVVKIGNVISYYENDVLKETKTATGIISTFIYSAIGGYGEGGNSSPILFMSNGSQIKNLSGTTHKFGNAYTDIARTTFATATDKVASISNTGSVGGFIIQATADNQGTLEGYESVNKSILSLNSSLE